MIECGCGFQFPTDWHSQYARGCSDGRLIHKGGTPSGGMLRRQKNPYYRQGFNHPTTEGVYAKDNTDWKSVVGDWKPKAGGLSSTSGYCERCGKDKDGRRARSSELCHKCESETCCRHRVSLMEKTCKAGVDLVKLAGDKPGIALRLPCFFFPGKDESRICHCVKFEPVTVQDCEDSDKAVEQATARFVVVGPLIAKVKHEHKGKNWQGVEKCPVCNGKLHMSHAAYNGHVHGRCETEDCLSWME